MSSLSAAVLQVLQGGHLRKFFAVRRNLLVAEGSVAMCGKCWCHKTMTICYAFFEDLRAQCQRMPELSHWSVSRLPDTRLVVYPTRQVSPLQQGPGVAGVAGVSRSSGRLAMPVASSKEGVKEKLLTALQTHSESAEGDLQKYLASKYVTNEQKAALREETIDFFALVAGANAPEKLGKWSKVHHLLCQVESMVLSECAA